MFQNLEFQVLLYNLVGRSRSICSCHSPRLRPLPKGKQRWARTNAGGNNESNGRGNILSIIMTILSQK